MKLYICYEDKGTSGICGMDYSPRQRLYVVEGTYEEIRQKLDKLESTFPNNGRRSPKLKQYYMEGNEDENDEYGFYNQVYYL